METENRKATFKEEQETINRMVLEISIKDIVVLYAKAKRFLTPKDKIELAEKVKDITEFLEDLIW